MSRAGTPTDNPVNESLNGWIKEELFMDFHLDDCRTRAAIRDTIERYVAFYNKQRPCYAIGYDTPNHYYQRYQRGELKRKDTFSKRILTTEPKFVQKKRQQKTEKKENQGTEGMQEAVSTPKKKTEKKYRWCLLLKKLDHEKWFLCLPPKKTLPKKHFSCLLFLTATYQPQPKAKNIKQK